MSNQGRRNLYKPSKELLETLLLYLDARGVATLVGVSSNTINDICRKYGINGKNLRAIRESQNKEIPLELLERLEVEEQAFQGSKSEPLIRKLDPDECVTVPEEVFIEPEIAEEEPQMPKFNTCDISLMVKSDNILDWLYMAKPKPKQDFYGGYIGVSNRRNSKGASDRNFHAVKLA